MFVAYLSTHDLGSCEYVRKVLGLYAAIEEMRFVPERL